VLKKRLRSEASLRPLVAQFVPLELDTATPAWQTWVRKFRFEGGGALPIVYVVRADGEMLYNKGGTIDELPSFLAGYRKQAGLALNPKQAKDLTVALEKAKAAHAEGDTATAMREINKFAATSTSYAAVALQGKELAVKLLEEAKASLEKAEQQLGSGDAELAGAVELLRVIRVYQPFKDVIKSAGQLRTKAQKEKKEVFTQAEALDAAAKLAETKAYDRATKAYQAIVQKFPGSAAAKLAEERIEEVAAAKNGTPASKKADSNPSNPGKAKPADNQP